jgi:catechol 2,3-dioxygenase-like lactoylglutathione lyase family enzyme
MRARAVGINHVALEVGDVDAALAFYGALFELKLRGRVGTAMAFVDLGDQFIAFSAPRAHPADAERHFGLVVDDREAVRAALAGTGTEILPGRGLNFRDPWGNRVEIVQYDEVQFSKTEGVLAGMGLGGLGKTAAARDELREKGLGPRDQPDGGPIADASGPKSST